MTVAAARPLAEVLRRWETPFERDPVSLESLSYDAVGFVLTLVLIRHSDELGFTIRFPAAQNFRVMDELGWVGETIHPDFAQIYGEAVAGRPVTSCMISASALRFSAWPEGLLSASGSPDWIYVVTTGCDCIEILANVPPEISQGDLAMPATDQRSRLN